MHQCSWRLLGALFLTTAVLVGASPRASASGTDLLGGQGTFEKPLIVGSGATFDPGDVIAGWAVKTAKVTVFRPVQSVIVPPQGQQGLSLVDAFHAPSHPAGKVCHGAPTHAGHNYVIPLSATVANAGTAEIVVQLGTASKRLSLPPATMPATWTSFRPKLRASAAGVPLCITAANGGNNAFPAVDAVGLIDLGS